MVHNLGRTDQKGSHVDMVQTFRDAGTTAKGWQGENTEWLLSAGLTGCCEA